jgi:FkbM family methyltransferase
MLHKLNYIQIGAGAGDLDARANFRDGFTEFVKKIDKNLINKVILVEPNPVNIPKLQESWKDYNQASIYNIGICLKKDQGQNIKFYYSENDAPHYQVFSLNPLHVLKHYPNDTLKEITVNCLDLETFITSVVGSEKIELLALDIEGIDAEIIIDTDWKNINCNLLSFEHLHLGDKKDQVLDVLKNTGFVSQGNGLDVNGFDWMYKKY